MLSLLGLAFAADPAAGARLFAASCTACHGTAGDGKGPAAVALNPKPANFTDPTFWKTRTDAQVGGTMRTGRPGTAMTGFPELTDTEVADLVAYLRTLSRTTP